MPKQRTLLGRPIPRFTIRRLTLLLLSLSIMAIICITTLTSSIPSPPSLSAYDRKISIPHIPHIPHVPHVPDSVSQSRFNPFRQASHPPPRQQKDNYGGSSWWADWKWLSVPFSSSLTLDEDRAILPPMKERPPIYCYYDPTIKKPADEKDAESDLLLTWRRAWWAQGFRPVILSAAEARNNPSYHELQTVGDMSAELKADLMRWLAWDTMDGGLLSHYTLLPVGPRDDPMLTFLRRGEYPQITRWQHLENGLFAASKAGVTAAIRVIMDPSSLKGKADVKSAVKEEAFKIEKYDESLAYYSAETIEKKYGKIAELAKKSRAAGLRSLNTLINSHLQISWQNSFPKGIEVLKPLPAHSTTMISKALKLAQSLAWCAETPMPASCPPNKPKCTPCVSMTPMRVWTPSRYHNSTKHFTIGTVPHPWTTATVTNMREEIDLAWIRRESTRDAWLSAVTQSLLGTGVSGDIRVVNLKQIIAGPFAPSYSLWLTAEQDMPEDIDWYFGFAIPKHAMDNGKTLSPVPAERLHHDDEDPDIANGPVATSDEIAREPHFLDLAKQTAKLTRDSPEKKLRTSLEAWNLGDTEAWKFTRAFQARRAMERAEWEEDERKYSAGSGSEKGRSSWNRWQDRDDYDEDA
jgi:hypothetical protein